MVTGLDMRNERHLDSIAASLTSIDASLGKLVTLVDQFVAVQARTTTSRFEGMMVSAWPAAPDEADSPFDWDEEHRRREQ